MMKSIFSLQQLSLLALLSCSKIYNIAAFTIQNVVPSTQCIHNHNNHNHIHQSSSSRNSNNSSSLSNKNKRPSSSIRYNMVSDPLVSSSESSKIVDDNGVAFTEGCTIQITKEIKAYHVAKKGFGRFDTETKSFIPLLEGNEDIRSIPRVERCLILSKGVRGIVKKVYDIDEYDATSPIVARFEDGVGLGGELVTPVTFLMHFETHEVEVVE